MILLQAKLVFVNWITHAMGPSGPEVLVQPVSIRVMLRLEAEISIIESLVIPRLLESQVSSTTLVQ